MIRSLICISILLYVGTVCATEQTPRRKINALQTKGGVPFAIWGEKPADPAPTLFIFAGTAADTLGNAYYRQCGNQLVKHGFLCVSVDLPGHGAFGPKDTGGIAGWRIRTDGGLDFVAKYNKRLMQVLDHLIAEGYTDPKKVVACGTSRGGFIAMHFAAADPRIKCTAAFGPVTDLAALLEFRGAEQQPLVQSLALVKQAEKLAGRPVWMVIGGSDHRVGTNCAKDLAKAVAESAAKKKLQNRMTLKIDQDVKGHAVAPDSAEAAATWILSQFQKNSKEVHGNH